MTKQIHVLKYKDACVHVVDQTYFDTPDPEDECYLALVTIPSPKITSVQKTPSGVNNAGDTCDVAPPVEPEIPLEYRDLAAAFDLGEVTLPEHGPQDLAIDLVDGKIPPMGTLYNLSESELLVVQKYVKDMTEKGLIRPSTSPTGAPILFAKKKDGTLRLCVDYRRLNDHTVKNAYPLPLINEMLDRIALSVIYLTLDLKDAYWLIRIKRGDEWKTAFRTRYGLFEYLVMPFGLSNAPGTFQAHVNKCFSDMLDIFVQIFLDDFLIYSASKEEHVQHVRAVLKRCIEKKLRVNLKKCKFHTDRVEFLGYEVTPTGVNMILDRVQTIREWLSPTHVKSLQSFLGFCNFYRSFIHDYSEIATPLTNLTKKGLTWQWTKEADDAFIRLKNAFCTGKIVRHFNPKLPIILETDASDFAISGVLSQVHSDGTYPVGYFSRKLKAAELNYDTHDKELLAIIESLKGWRHFTMETPEPIQIMTDHNNLKYFMSTKELNCRQVRWAQFLADFNFVLSHRPGKDNVLADALSRREQDELDIGDKEQMKKCLLPSYLFASIQNKDKVVKEQSQMEKEIAEYNLSDEYFLSTMQWMHSFRDKNRSDHPPNSGRLSKLEMTSADDDLTDEGFFVEDGLLYYQDRLYVPKVMRVVIMRSRHDTLAAGHFGSRKTAHLIERDYWWPKMSEDVKHYVTTFDVCQRSKASRRKYSGTLQPLPVPSERWQVVTMDFITDLPECRSYDSICTVVDRFTKMAHFWPCNKTITAEQTALLYIDKVWRLHGFPVQIISDRGTQFASELWDNLLSRMGVQRVMSTAYHPETDGQSERVNGVINQYLRVYCTYLQDDWVDLLATAEFSYNNSWQAAPFIANFGRNPSFDSGEAKSFTDVPSELADRLYEVREFISKNLEKAREDQKRFAD